MILQVPAPPPEIRSLTVRPLKSYPPWLQGPTRSTPGGMLPAHGLKFQTPAADCYKMARANQGLQVWKTKCLEKWEVSSSV